MVILKNYQTEQPCLACGRMDLDRCFHHVKTQGSGGQDISFNLMPLCFEHHTEVHFIGLTQFGNKYESVNDWLFIHEWDFYYNENKWRRNGKKI